jgi:hypothetical protein
MANDNYTVLYAYGVLYKMAKPIPTCLWEETVSAGTCLRAAQADKKFPMLCQYRVKAINVSSHAIYAVPPAFFIFFSSRFSFDVFCAFFFTSLLAP